MNVAMPRPHPPSLTLGLDGAAGRKRAAVLIRRVLAAPGPLRVAAAYVTGEVEASLGLRASRLRDLTLLCEPFSGNCDPGLLDRLTDAGADVRAVPHLHAKVFASESGVVIGSANVSGAALIGTSTRTIEAVVSVEGRAHAAEVTAWFDTLATDARRWDDLRRDPVAAGMIRQAWARKQTQRGQRGGQSRTVPLLEALRGSTPFDWEGLTFALVVQHDEGPSRRRAAGAVRQAGYKPPKEWDFDWMEDATAADLDHVREYASRPDGTDVVTLYVRLNHDEHVAAITDIDETVWRLLGGAMADGTLYVAYAPSTSPLGLGRTARRAAVAALNAGLEQNPRIARRLDYRRFVDPAMLAKLLA